MRVHDDALASQLRREGKLIVAEAPPVDLGPPGSESVRVLIVEDSILVGLAIEAVCGSLGWEMVGPARSIAQGLAMARDSRIDAALLDVSLGGELSWDIAALLQERGIPFVFGTGHDLEGQLPAAFAAVPVLRKPFRLADIERAMLDVLAPPPT